MDTEIEKFRQFIGEKDTQAHKFLIKMIEEAPMNNCERFLLQNAYLRLQGLLETQKIKKLDDLDDKWYENSLSTMLRALKIRYGTVKTEQL